MGRIILFAQQKGGAGKTMLLTQIGTALAAQGRTVSIVDLDPQRSAAEWHQARAKAGRSGLSLVESANWRAASDIQKAARTSDLTLIDSPGTAEVLRRVALRAADFCIVPCQPSAADVWACRQTLEIIEGEGTPHVVVLNRVPPRSNAADAATAELASLGAPVAEATLGSRSAYAEAFMEGAGVTETAPRSKAATEIEALVAELAPLLKG
jgi:chromosome partitioning protein